MVLCGTLYISKLQPKFCEEASGVTSLASASERRQNTGGMAFPLNLRVLCLASSISFLLKASVASAESAKLSVALLGAINAYKIAASVYVEIACVRILHQLISGVVSSLPEGLGKSLPFTVILLTGLSTRVLMVAHFEFASCAC